MNKGHEKINGCDCIEALRCGVCNCVYNDKSEHCTAQSVKIGPQYANTSADTVCDTFKAE